jgi:hypothetical protein
MRQQQIGLAVIILVVLLLVVLLSVKPRETHDALSASVGNDDDRQIERDVIAAVAKNPALIEKYVAFDFFKSGFRDFDFEQEDIHIQTPTDDGRVLHMKLGSFFGLADSIFGDQQGSELHTLRRWFRSAAISVENYGRSIVLRAPLFTEQRSVKFDAELWISSGSSSEGQGFRLAGREENVNWALDVFPSDGLLTMTPKSFDLEFEMKYVQGSLSVVRAHIHPGSLEGTFLDLSKLPDEYRTTQAIWDVLDVWKDLTAFTPLINQRLSEALQKFLNSTFV